MEKPSITAVEYDHTPMSETEVSIERLEFGKFCVSSDGPIERNRENIPIEHSQLGWSAGFPKELIPACYPTKLGIVQEDGETLPHNNEHGTVLRPVVRGAQKEARQVFYRVKARAEDGEGKSGRRYTLARYLEVPGERVNPLTMFGAMDSVKLKGITRVDARDIACINTELQEPELDHITEAFLSEALIYILSGVAISITEEISERRFFSLVAAAFNRLPTVLRPYVSAGWNVGSSYSGKLGISYTAHRAASTAHFSPTALTWSSPASVTTWNSRHEPVMNAFFEGRLEPGRLFERYVFNEERLVESYAERLSTLVGSLPAVDFPELPGWDDPGTVRIFRYPGLQARDQFTITALTEWLENKTNDNAAPIVLNVRELSYQANRLKALSLILHALSQAASRHRADRALWLSVAGKIPLSFSTLINARSGSGSDRARLMAAIGSGDVLQTLRALKLAEPAEAENLADDVRQRLFDILGESLSETRGTLPFHEDMLVSPPTPYREWVQEHALELMSALASQDKIAEASFTSIARINGADTVNELHRLITGQTPTSDSLSLLSRLSQPDRRIFVEFFNREWARKDEQTAERRTALITWFDPLKSEAMTDPLLRLISGLKQTESEINEIADEVEHNYVPEPMLASVAVLALERWDVVGRRIISHDGPRRWVSVTNLWPRRYADVLGSNRSGTPSPKPEIARAAENLKMTFADLQRLVRLRFVNDSFNGAAPLLWNLALRMEPRIGSSISVLDLCTGFVNGQLPNGHFPAEDIRIFVQLVKESGYTDLTYQSLQRMWESASSYWQVRLLLTLFPNQNLVPSPAQLSCLIPHRTWLQDHLRNASLNRRNLFNVATESFHSIPSDKSLLWRDEFVSQPIWAAFSGVPVGYLPHDALRRALRTYSQPNNEPTARQPKEVVEQQAWMSCIFLDSYRNAASENLAVLRVLNEFLLPFLSYTWNRNTVEDAFDFVAARQNFPDYRTPEKSYDLWPNIDELMRRIVRFHNQKTLARVIREFYKNPNYASRDRHK